MSTTSNLADNRDARDRACPQSHVEAPAADAILADRLDVVDALYRFAAGQDLDDERLFASAFAEEAELDFVQPAARLGVELPVFRGKGQIVATIVPVVAKLDTTHTVTNPRVRLEGDNADLVALVEAQHLPKGDHGRHLLLKNIFRVKLRRDPGGWVITRMQIQNVWKTGDSRVLFP